MKEMERDRKSSNRRYAETLQIINRSVGSKPRISAAQMLGHIWAKLCKTFHMRLVDDRSGQRNAERVVIIPIKCIVDHGCLRHAPGVVPDTLREVVHLVAHDATGHLDRP